MAINATTSYDEDKKLIPAGNYPARCYSVIHIGTVEDSWQGAKKYFNKVRIAWEIPEIMQVYKEGTPAQPASISKEYTLSTAPKSNLRKMLASWRGKDFTTEETKSFDVTKLLGATCMLNIIHTTKEGADAKTYENIGSVSPLPKGLKCAPAVNSIVYWDYDTFDEILLECFPLWIQDKIKTSKEYYAKKHTGSMPVNAGHEPNITGDDEDDLPF